MKDLLNQRKKDIKEKGFWKWWKEGIKEQWSEMLDDESARQHKKSEERKERKAIIKEENQQIKEDARIRKKELKANNIAHCPKCKSTSIEYIERKKLSMTRGVAGNLLAGPVGGIVGAASKKPKGKVKCLNCGKEWKLK